MLNRSVEDIGKKFRSILDELKISKGYVLHSLRHTFTTNHFYLERPEKMLQEWLGHEKQEKIKK